MKSKPGVFGMIWGLVYGYILSAAVLPLISSNPAVTIPVPLLRPVERQPGAAAAQASNAFDQLFTNSPSPRPCNHLGIVIGAFIVLLLLLTVRSGVKGGAKKKG